MPDLVRWADSAQYVSEPATSNAPTVTLLSATPDPLGEIASLCAMYEGRVVRSLEDIDETERGRALSDMQLTKLSGPLEAVTFHFLIENVTRAWTHQAVRNRFAFIAQESMRFAVVEDWRDRVALPPSLAGSKGGEHYPAMDELELETNRRVWDEALDKVESVYTFLVNRGMPAEDARGLLPHAMTTRLHLVISLRSLLLEAGKRLCTQAQFEWRVVVAGMVNAIRAHANRPSDLQGWTVGGPDSWQWEAIADLLKPICYQEGKCGFMASMDRGCTIRKRVDANAAINRPSSEWGSDKLCHPNGCDHPEVEVGAISPAEWALDPSAARVKP